MAISKFDTQVMVGAAAEKEDSHSLLIMLS
jgi:hypothetical protein